MIARVRPQISNERGHPIVIEVVDDSVVNGHKTQIVVRDKFLGGQLTKADQKIFSFEKVLDPESTQQKVFSEVEGDSLCKAFMNGQNCTIFVYGPTSTGKTFTMQGNAEDIIHGNTGRHNMSVLGNQSPANQSNIIDIDDSDIVSSNCT